MILFRANLQENIKVDLSYTPVVLAAIHKKSPSFPEELSGSP